MMSADSLAAKIHEALGEKGSPSKEVKGMAKAIIAELGQGIVTFLPSTVTGNCPPGGPLPDGQASNGLIAGLVGPRLATAMAIEMGKGYPTAQLIGMATGITSHLMTGMVKLSVGSIQGVCGNTPLSPGPFVGSGSGGEVVGLDGDALASSMSASLGGSPTDKLKKKAKAIVKYIEENAEVSFLPTTVVGSCPPGGGPLLAGAANAGSIK